MHIHKTEQVEHIARTIHITEHRVRRYADLFVVYLATLSVSGPHYCRQINNWIWSSGDEKIDVGQPVFQEKSFPVPPVHHRSVVDYSGT